MDNVFAKVFNNSSLSLLIVLKIRHNVKCAFLFLMVGGLGEYLSDIMKHAVPGSLVLLRNDGNTSNQRTSTVIIDNKLLD